MSFANPLALLWGLLAVPVVILYLGRIRLRRRPVSTGMLWERVLAEQRARSAWQRWRHPVSLAVQLTALLLMVAALADPQVPGPRRIVLIVDNSASMDAADAKPARLAEAKRAATRLMARLRDCDQMAVLSAGRAVGVVSNLTNDQTVLKEALHKVEVSAGHGSTQVHAAVELARRMLAETPGGEIKLLTDGCFDGAARLSEAGDVEMIGVGKRTGNLAITGLQVRPTIRDPQRCQVLAEVSSFSDKPVECRLGLALDGKPLREVKIELGANGRWQEVFEERIAQPGRLTARLEPGDLYPADDVETVGTDGRREPAPWGGRPEGDLRVAENLAVDALEGVEVERPRRGFPPWLLLVAWGVLWLILEWCLCQRRWIC